MKERFKMRNGSMAKKQILRSDQKCKKSPTFFFISTSVVWVNGDGLRREAWESYQKKCKKLDQDTRKLEHFSNHEKNAFQLWMQTEFQEECANVRNCTQRLKEKAHLIQTVQAYSDMASLSLHLAYIKIKEAATPEEISKLFEACQAKEEGRDDDDDEWTFNSLEELFEKAWKEATGESREFGGRREEPSRSCRSDSTHINSNETYLRDLYHKLAMKLHPDKNPEQSQEDKDLFYKVQEAYQWRDVHYLEKLYKQGMQSTQGIFNASSSSISEIIARRKAVEKQIRKLGQKLREARCHPAWGFSTIMKNRNKSRMFYTEIKRELAVDLAGLEHELRGIENVIASWERKAKPTRSLPQKKMAKNKKT